MKTEAVPSSEMSVNVYQTARRYIKNTAILNAPVCVSKLAQKMALIFINSAE
jgi:hypothetical protein